AGLAAADTSNNSRIAQQGSSAATGERQECKGKSNTPGSGKCPASRRRQYGGRSLPWFAAPAVLPRHARSSVSELPESGPDLAFLHQQISHGPAQPRIRQKLHHFGRALNRPRSAPIPDLRERSRDTFFIAVEDAIRPLLAPRMFRVRSQNVPTGFQYPQR